MIIVEIPIADKKKPPVIKFGERCVHCGKPKQVVLPLKMNLGVQKKNGEAVMMDLPVPLCEECERKERRVTNVTLVPFTIAGLLFCGFVFVPVWLLMPDGTTPGTLGFSIIVGIFAGILAGVIGGSVFEFILRFLFAPVYGQQLLKRPLTG